jgi:hypothetical protein
VPRGVVLRKLRRASPTWGGTPQECDGAVSRSRASLPRVEILLSGVGVGENTINARPMYAEPPRDLDLADALCGQRPDLTGLIARGGLAALVTPLCLGLGAPPTTRPSPQCFYRQADLRVGWAGCGA